MQITELLPLQKKFMDLKSQLELKLYDLSLFQGRAEQNEHHKVFATLYLRYQDTSLCIISLFYLSFLLFQLFYLAWSISKEDGAGT